MTTTKLNKHHGFIYGTLLMLLVGLTEASVPVVINEFMADNDSSLADPQGQYDDWIELHNTGSTTVDLASLYLTDSLNETFWQFPADQPEATTIPAGGYLIVWADEDLNDSGLHASFKLSSRGESIYLIDNDAVTIIDRVDFESQMTDVSFGRSKNDSSIWHCFEIPSPGTANEQGYLGLLKPPSCSHGRGFYQEPFTVSLNTDTDGVQILYSLDGSDPLELSPRDTFSGAIYQDPIPVDRTTCLRFGAVKTGWKSSPVTTHTYLFLEQVIYQKRPPNYPVEWFSDSGLIAPSGDYEMDPEIYTDPRYQDLIEESLLAIPTISIVTSPAHLFDSQTGIYKNPKNSGLRWERPCSFEWITPDQSLEIQVNCGIRIQGGHTRNPGKNPKHSFRLNFKSDYGPTKLELPIFGDHANDRFDQIILRAGGNQSWLHHNTFKGQNRERAQYIRDQWAKNTQILMGDPGAANTYAHLYINGLYWGLYNPTERPNASFAAAYLGGDKESYDALNSGEVVDGSSQRWNQLFELANQGLASATAYETFSQWLDIDAFINYMILNQFGGNLDWDSHNWYAYAQHTPPGPFYFACWDNEFIFINDIEGGIHANRLGLNDNYRPGRLFQKLCENADFRRRFGDRVHELFFNQGLLTTEQVLARWNELSEQVEIPLIAEAARWGDYRRDVHPLGGPTPIPLYHPYGAWQDQREELLTEYFPQRSQIVVEQYRQAGLYPNIAAPTFRINNTYQHGGYLSSEDRLSMSAPTGDIYYTLDGSDPMSTTTFPPSETQQIVLVAETAHKRVLVPSKNISLVWRVLPSFDDSLWLSTQGGVGYERTTGYEDFFTLDLEALMDGTQTSCYVRIPFVLNKEAADKLESMTLNIRYDDGFVAYLNGMEIARRNIEGIPAWNAQANSIHTDSKAVNFEPIDVSNYLNRFRDGDNLLAIHGLNASTTSSDFLISAELVADQRVTTENHTIDDPNTTTRVYTEPITLTQSTQVKARSFDGKTWSALNQATYTLSSINDSLRVSEIMYHPVDPNEEFIELMNIGVDPINLLQVAFTKGINFVFPSLELSSGERTVVVRDRLHFETRYGTDINIAGQYTGNLDNAGERITLNDAQGQPIQSFRYQDNWYRTTDGQGDSLIHLDPYLSKLESWNNQEAWAPSTEIGGSPGTP